MERESLSAQLLQGEKSKHVNPHKQLKLPCCILGVAFFTSLFSLYSRKMGLFSTFKRLKQNEEPKNAFFLFFFNNLQAF